MSTKLLISSCLIGEKCAYDGRSRKNSSVIEFCKDHQYVHICPEVSGGLSCPRERYEITGGTGDDVLEGRAVVVSASGKDNTKNFIDGANKALQLSDANGVSVAILKSCSPSCGTHKIRTGDFNGNFRSGQGVTAALLSKNGVKGFTEHEVDKVRTILDAEK